MDFVRVGLDALILMGNDVTAKLSDLDPETVSYFKKLPGYDTLRIVLANKIVLVEGPSDEIIFERIFVDTRCWQRRSFERMVGVCFWWFCFL